MANFLGDRGPRSATRAPWALATEPTELEEVVVTGIRAGLRSSLFVVNTSVAPLSRSTSAIVGAVRGGAQHGSPLSSLRVVSQPGSGSMDKKAT